MSANLLESLQGYITPAIISQASSALGESEGGITKAIGAAFPTILNALVHKSTDSSAMDTVMGLAGNSGLNASSVLSNIPALLSGGQGNTAVDLGSKLLGTLFGGNQNGTVDMISNLAGIKSSSASSLLGMAAPLLLSHFASTNTTASGLTSLLGSQKSSILNAAPAGLASLLGLGGIVGGVSDAFKGTASAVGNVAGDVVGGTANVVGNVAKGTANVVGGAASAVGNTAGAVVEEGSSLIKKLLPLLLIAGLGLLAWFWFNNKKTSEATNDPTLVENTTGTTGDTSINGSAVAIDQNATEATAVVATKEATEVTLHDGTKLKAFKGGIEEQLITFLASDEYKNGTEESFKSKWFSFDNINYEFGSSSVITKESEVQIANIIAILKAYPTAKIKIGAYTDKKGDDAGNKALSQKRADNMKSRLAGVAAQVTGAEGYGEEFSKVPETGSDKERESDRKISVRFAK